jgi:uncharacterized protein
MEMHGQRQLKISQKQAWDALNDPAVLQQCITGCTHLTNTGDNKFDVGVNVKIGPVSAKFAGKIELSEVTPPQSYTLNFDGQGGVAGFGKGVSKVTLTPNETGTLLDYSVNAQVGGKIAQLGQRLIDGVAKSMADDFFGKFDTVMQERHGVTSTTADVTTNHSLGQSTAHPQSTQEASPQQTGVEHAASHSGSIPNAASDPSSKNSGSGMPVWLWLVIALAAGYAISRFI